MRNEVPSRIRYAVPVSITLMAAAAFAQPAPVSNAMLNGSWQLQTMCANNHGKPSGCIQPKKSHSLELIFSEAGTWRIAVPDPSALSRSGFYQVRKEQLVLKNTDGTIFEDWHLEYDSDGRHLVITNKKFIQTFERVHSNN